MERGVLITETPQGFVCANGGVDASNVGPESGDLVTLLPVDADASAGRIRAAVRDRFGTTSGSSSPTASGGHGAGASSTSRSACPGSMPVEDLRGTPDADGRVMKSTVRAIADELASAAELALGKTGRRPAALVRGASPLLGEGSVRGEGLIPSDWDLFR